jgi:hypothetical protein
MVLATDMKQHFAIHGAFQTKIAASNGSASGRLMSRISNSSGSNPGADGMAMDEDTRSLVLQVRPPACCITTHLCTGTGAGTLACDMGCIRMHLDSSRPRHPPPPAPAPVPDV